MFKYQHKAQRAQDLAKNYLFTTKRELTPKEYFELLKRLEKEFLIILEELENK